MIFETYLKKNKIYLMYKNQIKSILIVFNLVIIIICNSANLFAQSHLGKTLRNVHFRSGPGKEFEIISTLKQGQQIFIVSTETENDYYNIIDIQTNKEGFINKKFVILGPKVEEQDGGQFQSDGSISNYSPEAEIFNNTNKELTLKINSDNFIFDPYQTRTITLNPGSSNYRASAPGVIPSIGYKNFESNMKYKWKFYIITHRR